jgi:hypothetical protein
MQPFFNFHQTLDEILFVGFCRIVFATALMQIPQPERLRLSRDNRTLWLPNYSTVHVDSSGLVFLGSAFGIPLSTRRELDECGRRDNPSRFPPDGAQHRRLNGT